MNVRPTALRIAAAICLLALAGRAELIEVARDDGAHYAFTNGWTGNGGVGFDDWVFRATNTSASGAAGFFLGGPGNGDLNSIGSSSNRAWGTYANGPDGWQACAAFRGFGWSGITWTNGLAVSGETFRVAFEHGNIDSGGTVGFCLRNGNVDGRADDYNAGARFEFVFMGDSATYSVFAGDGFFDTDISYREDGLDVEVALTGTNTYTCTVRDPARDGVRMRVFSGALAGDGPIESVALFNRKSSAFAFNNTYFNRMSLRRVVIPIPPLTLTVR